MEKFKRKLSIDLGLVVLSARRRKRPDQTFTLEAIAEACDCRHEAIRLIQERALAKVRRALSRELKLAGYSSFAESFSNGHYISSKRRALSSDEVRYAGLRRSQATIDSEFPIAFPATGSVRWFFLRDAECRPPKELL